MKHKKAFTLILISVTFALGYSFVHKRYINRSYKLFYSNNTQVGYCYETTVFNSYRFSEEEIIFTILNNIITGPKNVFMDSVVEKPVSISKVLLSEDMLTVDFNRYLMELNSEEESQLFSMFIYTLQSGFPHIRQMVWLVQGRQVSIIKGIHRYVYPSLIESYFPLRSSNQETQDTALNHTTFPSC